MHSPLQFLTVFLCGAAATVVHADGLDDAARSILQHAPTLVAMLPEGEYFRPMGPQVSGFPGATTQYLRSPCPALNTLANHGYLPRDGKNVTPEHIKNGIMSVYNIDVAFATSLVSSLNATLTLASLSVHNFIEHDASMVHADAYYNQDPAALDDTLFVDLIGREVNGRLGVPEVGAFRKDLYTQCAAKPPGCDLGARAQSAAFGESALLLIALGDKTTESISVASAVSFLVNERIPFDYKKPATPITSADFGVTSAKIKLLAPVPV